MGLPCRRVPCVPFRYARPTEQPRPAGEQRGARHERLLDRDAVGAAGTHAEGAYPRPSRRESRSCCAARRTRPALADRLRAGRRVADEVRGVGNAGGVVPGAVDDIAAIHPPAGSRRRRPVRRDEVAVGAEQLDLGLLRPVRRDRAHAWRRASGTSRRPVAARDLDHRLVKGRDSRTRSRRRRLGAAVEAGRNERLLQLRRVATARFGLVLLGAQPGRRATARAISSAGVSSGSGADMTGRRKAATCAILGSPSLEHFPEKRAPVSERKCDQVQIIETAFRPDSGLDERHAIEGADEGQRTPLGAGADLQ